MSSSKGIKLAALGAVIVVLLGACGGGSNSPSSPNPPPAVQPPPPPPPPPQDPPPAQNPPPIDAHLALTNTPAAHERGITGAGVRIGVIDSGVNRQHPTLAGRVLSNLVYLPPGNDLSVDDKVGHGTWVSQTMAGSAFGQWPGGIAPGASIISARIIADAPPEDDGSGQGNEVTGTGTGAFFRQLNDEMIGRNARIINNSWGGLYWSRNEVTQSFYDAYSRYVLNFGGLVVFATGNASFPNPSDTAALPSKSALTAPLERGWLAVAALDTNAPHQLAGYSNACGVAMNYCLVAPGRVVVTGHTDTAGNPTYWVVAGTSLAAPQVAGAAALVWQAFPYFDNDLVRQTLLGTAKDLGEPGPDPIFGYGLLDVGRAVQGPGRFDWGDVSVGFSGESVWSNAITGAGGLVKRGPGTLFMSSGDFGLLVHRYLGDTRVDAGRLVLDRVVLDASHTRVASGARLDLDQASVKSLHNLGTVNAIGPASVGGDYVHAQGADLGLLVGHVLMVGGKAQIEGGSLTLLGKRPGYVHYERETILLAGGGVQGQFQELKYAPGVLFDGRVVYTDSTIDLEIERLDVSAAGLNLSASAQVSAVRIDQAFAGLDDGFATGRLPPGTEGFVEGAGRFQAMPDGVLGALSVSSLAGDLHAARVGALLEGLSVGLDRVAARSAERLTMGAGQVGASSWAGVVDGGQQSSLSELGANTRISGLITGADRFVAPGVVLGATLMQADVQTALQGLAGHAQGQVQEAGVYAGFANDRAMVTTRLAAGRVHQDTQRQVLLGLDLAGLGTRTAGRYRLAGLDVRPAQRGAETTWGFTPFAASRWIDFASDGFQEVGAWGFGLDAPGSRHRHWDASAGVEFDGRGPLGGSWRVQLAMDRTLSSSGLIDAGFTGWSDARSPLASGLGARTVSRIGWGVDLPMRLRGALSLEADHRTAGFGAGKVRSSGQATYRVAF